MAGKKDPNIEKVTLNLRRGDREWLIAYLEGTGSTAGWSTLVRTLVATRVDQLKAAQAASENKTELQKAAASIDLDNLISGV